MKSTLSVAALALPLVLAGTASAASGETIKECAALSGNAQVSRFGNQYVLVKDGDAYYRLSVEHCDMISLATRLEVSAESQPGRICPANTRIKTNTGNCRAGRAELIDEATYLRYQRRR